MSRKKPQLAALEERLGYVFRDRTLLEAALTHMSAPEAESSRLKSYQRLEFLGDRVLGVCIARMLYERFATSEEGDMSRRLAELVRKESCAAAAVVWNVAPYLRLGEGEMQSGARKNRAILADICEAIIGAVYLDGGHDAAQGLVERAFGEQMLKPARPLRDAKTALQEWAQGKGYPTPTYSERGRFGPDHAPMFKVAACVQGLMDALAEGRSKRFAEQAAAEAFLRREGLWAEMMEQDDGQA